MGLFRKEPEWDNVHSYLKNSFANVKKDTASLFEWIQFLHQKLQQQEHTITAMHEQLNNSMLTPKDIKELIDDHYALQHMAQVHQRIHLLNKKIDILASMHDRHNSQLTELHDKLENIHHVTEKKSSSLKEKLIKRLTRNSKTYVKNAILSYIEKYQEVSALQLKEMLVEEQQLCSKSSFYRLLQELEGQEKVGIIKEGKQKIYLMKSLRASRE